MRLDNDVEVLKGVLRGTKGCTRRGTRKDTKRITRRDGKTVLTEGTKGSRGY